MKQLVMSHRCWGDRDGGAMVASHGGAAALVATVTPCHARVDDGGRVPVTKLVVPCTAPAAGVRAALGRLRSPASARGRHVAAVIGRCGEQVACNKLVRDVEAFRRPEGRRYAAGRKHQPGGRAVRL